MNKRQNKDLFTDMDNLLHSVTWIWLPGTCRALGPTRSSDFMSPICAGISDAAVNCSYSANSSADAILSALVVNTRITPSLCKWRHINRHQCNRLKVLHRTVLELFNISNEADSYPPKWLLHNHYFQLLTDHSRAYVTACRLSSPDVCDVLYCGETAHLSEKPSEVANRVAPPRLLHDTNSDPHSSPNGIIRYKGLCLLP